MNLNNKIPSKTWPSLGLQMKIPVPAFFLALAVPERCSV